MKLQIIESISKHAVTLVLVIGILMLTAKRYHAYRYYCNAPAHRRNHRISFQSSSTDCQDSIYLFHCRYSCFFLTNKTYIYENKYMYIFRSCHAGCMATERTYPTGQKTSAQYC